MYGMITTEAWFRSEPIPCSVMSEDVQNYIWSQPLGVQSYIWSQPVSCTMLDLKSTFVIWIAISEVNLYHVKQNTLYLQRWKILRRQFLEVHHWFLDYTRGEVINSWKAGLILHKIRYRKKLSSQDLPP